MSNDKTLVGDLEDMQLCLENDFKSDSDEYRLLDRIIAELKRREWRPISEINKSEPAVLYAPYNYPPSKRNTVLYMAERTHNDYYGDMIPAGATHFLELPEPPTEQTT